jgi:hypothetical protein
MSRVLRARTLWALAIPFLSMEARASLLTARLPLGLLRSIRSVASKEDSQVQIADVLAGCGRATATLAGHGVLDDELQNIAREMLDCNGMWLDGSSLDVSWDIAPPQYYRAWIAANS